MPSGDAMSALKAELEPMVDSSDPDERRDGFTFKPGEYGTPERNLVPVRVFDTSDADQLLPSVVFWL